MLNLPTVLVLNRHWQAIHVKTPANAFCKMVSDAAMMPLNSRSRFLAALAALTLSLAAPAQAGPPYATDDLEPVDLHHWEIILASQHFHDADGWSGTSPHIEINYGAVPDVQLHILLPVVYNKPVGEPGHIGYGDTELGVKYRFVHETDILPQIAIYPSVELPSGDRAEDLGNGRTQVFLPIWFQKKFGDWTTFGGGGYWVNPGPGNQDHWFAGWALQRKLADSFAAGLEVQFRTPDKIGDHNSTVLNAGGTWDLSDTYHILFSAGHTVQGRSEFQGYLGLQITFGPQDDDKSKK